MKKSNGIQSMLYGNLSPRAVRSITCMIVLGIALGVVHPRALPGLSGLSCLQETLAHRQSIFNFFSFSSQPLAVMNDLVRKAFPLPGGLGKTTPPQKEKQDDRAAPSQDLLGMRPVQKEITSFARAAGKAAAGAPSCPLPSGLAPPGEPSSSSRHRVPLSRTVCQCLAVFFLSCLPRSSIDAGKVRVRVPAF